MDSGGYSDMVDDLANENYKFRAIIEDLSKQIESLRAQVTEARRVNEVQIESLRLANDALVRQREEARQVARTFIVHANSSCDECAAAADIVDAWPLPGVAL